MLAKAYESFLTSKRIEKIVDDAIEEMEDEEVDIPEDLRDKLAEHLSKNPEMRWDAALADIIPDEDD
jgi:hypothetical protein